MSYNRFEPDIISFFKLKFLQNTEYRDELSKKIINLEINYLGYEKSRNNNPEDKNLDLNYLGTD